MKRWVSFALACSLLLLATDTMADARGLLWRVVQACIVNHGLTGASFPCLAVDISDGLGSGYAVIRAPLQKTHIIVTPTVPTIGIEADRLQAADAPDYFADAWRAGKYVRDAAARAIDRYDLAMAVNSRPGRSQDQLHIHVDCLRPTVRRMLAQQDVRIKRWTRVTAMPGAPRYWASALQSDDLVGVNIFKFVAKGLKLDFDRLEETTIVVIPAPDVEGRPGFVVMARQLVPGGRDLAHGEALLDHNCRSFR